MTLCCYVKAKFIWFPSQNNTQKPSLLSDIMGQHRRMGESFNDTRRLSWCKILMKGEKKGEMVKRERQSTCNWRRVERWQLEWGQLNLTVRTMGSGSVCGLGKRGVIEGDMEKKNLIPLFSFMVFQWNSNSPLANPRNVWVSPLGHRMAIPKLVHLWKMKVKGELRRLGRGRGLGTYSFNFPGTIENMMQKYLMSDLKKPLHLIF